MRSSKTFSDVAPDVTVMCLDFTPETTREKAARISPSQTIRRQLRGPGLSPGAARNGLIFRRCTAVLVPWQLFRTDAKTCVGVCTCKGGPVLELVEVAEGQEWPGRASNECTPLACTTRRASECMHECCNSRVRWVCLSER